MPPTIDAQLAALAELQRRHAALTQAHAQARQAALPPWVQALLQDLEDLYAPQLATLALAIAARTTQVQASVLTQRHSVTGHGLLAVYVPGRAAWDDHALQGFAAVHPEILPFRTVGAPAVRVRTAGAPANNPV
jgi:hypothetical protein